MMSRLKRLLTSLASLRLTVFILSAALVLVFAGTLAQVKFGLWAVQEQYFQSWFIWWSPESGQWRVPIYPGGHLIGALLLVNLAASYIVRFSWAWKKTGIQLIHIGLIVMLVGGLVTDLFSVSSYMRIQEGGSSNFSQDEMNVELAVTDASDPDKEVVTVIPRERLEAGNLIRHDSLPFEIKVLRSHRNSSLHVIGHGGSDGREPASSEGSGSRIALKPLPLETKLDARNVMSVVVELLPEAGGSLGSWLVSDTLASPQRLTVGDKEWTLQLRPRRYYKPYTLTLLDFTHETYPGTTIPKDFSSTVMLDDEANNEHRKVRIFMNHPLRYGGETYYQSGYTPDNSGTVLQVVRNPGYQAPYVACVIMSLGLIYQFTFHLVGFTRRNRKAAQS